MSATLPHFIRRLSRIPRSRGFGVQSPWAYRFVRSVACERRPYYAYEDHSQHLLSLINDILEMSRIESGKIEQEYVPCSLDSVLDETVNLFDELMRQKGLRFAVHGSQITHRYVWCDKRSMSRVLLNLVSNAFKFTPAGGEVTVTLLESGAAEGGYGSYELRVKDTGIGMSAEFVDKMFVAFERERTSTASGMEGTGLGLPITKSLVELMGGTIDVLDMHCIDPGTFRFGEVQAQCGNAAFQYIKKAIELAMANEVDGTVTAPLNKEALNLAGHHYDGHTEIYATFTNTKKYAMMLADENIRVIHVSTHVPLRKACDLVKKARVIECVELIDDACRQFGIDQPLIAVAGLNPHSSENGMFGYEEAQEIIPAIEELRQRGFNVDGPVPPDSVFAKAKCGKYDGVVAMYHDQGHIPLKVCAFNWNKETGQMESASGVNITLGLPIIRVSVDHGTAFDVAGRGIANDSAMTLSIDYATRMAIYRKAKLNGEQ